MSVAAVAGALVGGAVAYAVTKTASPSTGGVPDASGGGHHVATARVVRTTLTNSVQAGGSISFAGTYTVPSPTGADSRGTSAIYTWLPAVGAVIREDGTVFSINGESVPLLYGAIPAYRPFRVGMSDGVDVGQLTRDLIALGFGSGLAPSNHFSNATAAAVERWQKARSWPTSGVVNPWQVVFEPGPLRVTSVGATVGASVGQSGGGSVLTATSLRPLVVVQLGVSEEYLVKNGDTVSVVLPDGVTTVTGRIVSVGTVASCAGGSGIGSGLSPMGESPCSSVGNNSSAEATVTVLISLGRLPHGEVLDQAPVNVNITTQRATNVLAVPINALLALAGGGYGVDVVSGTGSHLVGVTTGLYGNTLVQVTGAGLAVGTRVEVPSS